MFDIEPCSLPTDALLRRYSDSDADDRAESFTDCYSVQVTGDIGLDEFVLAFYTTPLFRIERLVLALIGKPSSDEQAATLAQGDGRNFAAWLVEDRAEDQLLMCDFRGRTRSWFMVLAIQSGTTRLYFGSAVVQERRREGKKTGRGWLFDILLGFHKLYSKALLSSARRRLARQ